MEGGKTFATCYGILSAKVKKKNITVELLPLLELESKEFVYNMTQHLAHKNGLGCVFREFYIGGYVNKAEVFVSVCFETL